MARRQTLLIGHPDGGLNLRLPIHGVARTGLLAAATLVLAGFALRLGSIPLSWADLAEALAGRGPESTSMVVLGWRAPRIAMALVIGAALGMSGAVFQSLIRNPLGSPDVIGFGAGAQTGALITMILLAGDPLAVALGAVGGGLVTAAAVYVLAWRHGVQGFRLILVGVAVSAMLSAFNIWLTLVGGLEAVMSAAVWGAGSLNAMSWSRAAPSAVLCLVGMALCLALGRPMRLLEMGDDMASALGVPAERTRLWLMGLGVALTAAATAAAGPIAFVALAAPQIAQRLTGARAASLSAAAWTGALLLLAADIAAQHALAPLTLPVGLVTICLGGLYLIWLLLRDGSR